MRAVKILTKQQMTESERSEMINEINILKEMDHPNIVNIYEYFEDAQFLYIVMELIEGGCLWDRFFEMRNSVFSTFGEKEAR